MTARYWSAIWLVQALDLSQHDKSPQQTIPALLTLTLTLTLTLNLGLTLEHAY